MGARPDALKFNEFLGLSTVICPSTCFELILNAPFPTDVIEEGIDTQSNLLQPAKQFIAIDVNVSGISTNYAVKSV